MKAIHNSILETIGNTPIVRINNLGPRHCNIFVKIESFNPMGSVKDRLALGVIEDAERRGVLKPGQTVVEATSGNTGIGLAMVCAQKGYPLVVTMAENFSIERRKMMRFLGAKVVLTPASEKGTGMVAKAEELARRHGWWQPKQFENPANADIHAETTAVEIVEAFKDISLDYWVTGFGTGGTFNGVSRVLRERSPSTRVMICEPDNSQMLASGIPQQHDEPGTASASHPRFRPHLMQGWSPDFIPGLVEEAMEHKHADGFVPVDGADSMQCARDLARKEGIFVGISAGATFLGALNVAKTAQPGTNILCMLPDTGERYLTTPLFDGIAADMTEEETGISHSTPHYRFDVSGGGGPAPVNVKAEPEAVRAVAALISDPDQPVVMFALEWCEFCWSVRKVLQAYGIAYRSVDLDSVAYQQNEEGGKLRVALRERSGSNTFPQIFVRGEFIGGCTDLFERCKDGSLARLLEQSDIPFNASVDIDPYSMLPGWLHPR